MKSEIINFDGQQTIDSREVAKMIGKRHDNLIRDIRQYISYINESSEVSSPNDFFIESSYLSAQGKVLPCYKVTKAGCEIIANKLNGKKGVLFTTEYVTLFNQVTQGQVEITHHLTPEEIQVKRDYIDAMNRQSEYHFCQLMLKMANKTRNPIYLHELDKHLLPDNVELPMHISRRLTNQIDLF